MAPGDGRLPRRPLRPDGADTNNDAGQHQASSTAITELDHQQRADLRDLLSKQFAQGPHVRRRWPATTRPTSASAA